MNKKIFLPAIAAAVMGAGLMGGNYAFAQGTQDQTTLVQQIADKFGLKSSDVQAVFDNFREQEKEQNQTNYENYLSGLVSQGKITDAQKTLLLNKHKELQAEKGQEFATLKSMTPEQRQDQRKSHRQNLQDWAKQNNIPIQYLFGGMGMGIGKHGMGM